MRLKPCIWIKRKDARGGTGDSRVDPRPRDSQVTEVTMEFCTHDFVVNYREPPRVTSRSPSPELRAVPASEQKLKTKTVERACKKPARKMAQANL